jgi:dienelactone hydrolase
MKQDKIDIRGRNGLSIPNSLIRQDEGNSRLAVFFPGLTYRNIMPVLYYPRQLLLERGYDILSINYAYDQIPEFMDLSEEDKIAWIGMDARAAMAAVFALGRYKHFTLVGKSLGTAAMAAVAPHEPRLASAELIWLTPGFKTHGVLENMARCSHRSLIVLGTEDPHYEEAYIEAARARGAEVVLLPGLDHGLEKPGRVVDSVAAMHSLIERISSWCDASSR